MTQELLMGLLLLAVALGLLSYTIFGQEPAGSRAREHLRARVRERAGRPRRLQPLHPEYAVLKKQPLPKRLAALLKKLTKSPRH